MTTDERAAEIAAIKAKLERIDNDLAAIQQAHDRQRRQRVSWFVLRLTCGIVADGSGPGMSIFTDWPPVAI